MEFETTDWKLVTAARSDSVSGHQAMEVLCQVYREPVLAYIRRIGCTVEDSKDITQDFFQEFLRRKIVNGCDPDLAKFRTYLKASVRHFVSHHRAKESAIKRGGHMRRAAFDPGDTLIAETRPSVYPPDVAFDRSWALTILSEALTVVREKWTQKGDGALFDVLHLTLSPAGDTPKYGDISDEFSMSIDAVKKRVQRLRDEYGEAVRQIVRSTLASDSDEALKLELQTLREVLATDLKSPF